MLVKTQNNTARYTVANNLPTAEKGADIETPIIAKTKIQRTIETPMIPKIDPIANIIANPKGYANITLAVVILLS